MKKIKKHDSVSGFGLSVVKRILMMSNKVPDPILVLRKLFSFNVNIEVKYLVINNSYDSLLQLH